MSSAPTSVSTVAIGATDGSVNEAAIAIAAIATTPTRARTGDLRLRFAKKPAKASEPSITHVIRVGP